ncbi:MAG: hypothetical protein IJ417_07630, partial [Bacteroidaceae bacterium]|nr:hypothetical protein [Bacteroidaceae bacterium]
MKHQCKISMVALCLAATCIFAACAKDAQTGTEVTPTAEVTATVDSTQAPTEALEATDAPEATETPAPTATHAPTATAAPTAIPEPTVTPEPTATPVPTATPEPTKAPAVSGPTDVTYDFNDLLYQTSYGTEYTIDNDGSISLRYEKIYQEIKLSLPEVIDMSHCLGVTVKMKSEAGNLAVKLYDKDFNEVFVR